MNKCPYCDSKKIQKRGGHPRQRYYCNDKKHPEGKTRWFSEERSPANILVFDIETLPMEVYAWRLGEENWSPDNIIRDWCVLSYSAKWLFEPKSISNALTPKEALAHDDRRLVNEIHALFNKANIIIAHNGDNFDLPKMNTRFLYYHLDPPTPYLSIDTRATAKKAFGFTSNKLAYLSEYLGHAPKLPTDYKLWVRCAHGDKDAIKYMQEYNEQDIYTLEDVYIDMRPWIKHPNMSLYVVVDEEAIVCPRCGHDKTHWEGEYNTSASVYPCFRCDNCGAIGRAKTADLISNSRVV